MDASGEPTSVVHLLEELHQAVLGALVDGAVLPDGVADRVLEGHQVRLGQQRAGIAALGPLTADRGVVGGERKGTGEVRSG